MFDTKSSRSSSWLTEYPRRYFNRELQTPSPSSQAHNASRNGKTWYQQCQNAPMLCPMTLLDVYEVLVWAPSYKLTRMSAAMRRNSSHSRLYSMAPMVSFPIYHPNSSLRGVLRTFPSYLGQTWMTVRVTWIMH